MNHLGKNVILLRSMGKLFTVSGVFLSDDECNAWLRRNPDHGVIANAGPVALTAHLYTGEVRATEAASMARGDKP